MKQSAGRATVAELYAAHARSLLLYARQWLDDATAEDAVQRVFVRVLSAGWLPDDPRTWLFKCVRNEAIDVWRSDRRRETRERAAASDQRGWFVSRPEDALDAHEAQAALQSLPAEQRETVTLRLWSGLTLEQIAQVMDVAVSTAFKRYEAAIESLRQRLEKPCNNQKR